MYRWNATASISQAYVCGFCGKHVGPNIGYYARATTSDSIIGRILICPSCLHPTFFDAEGKQTPGVAFGKSVDALPPDVGTLYDEARRCMSVAAYTTAVMACRKLLMHIAVEKGGDPNKSFKHYVDWLVEHHYVPPGGEGWADRIRGKGNEATHEIELLDQHSAEQIISFVELLLTFVYEMPVRAGISEASDNT